MVLSRLCGVKLSVDTEVASLLTEPKSRQNEIVRNVETWEMKPS
jgi:hypothetical protein